MTIDELVMLLNDVSDRGELLALMAPLRLSLDIPDEDKGRVTEALIAAASRGWKGRISA
jgi:hypothetical protein